MHKNMPFRYEITEEEVETTLEELKKKYGDAQSKKQSVSAMLEEAKKKYDELVDETVRMMQECQQSINRLR